MALTRTRIILIGAVAALVLLAVACAGGLGDRDEAGSAYDVGPADGSSVEIPSDPSAYPASEEGEDAALAARGAVEGERAASGDSTATDPKLQNLLDRKIIQSTSIDIEVEEVGRNFQEIVRVAETAGGFVASSTFSNLEGQQVADVTVRVPADRYQAVLAQIRSMGEVAQESSDANDVTEEYTDLQARLRTLEATERRYLELLGQARDINEILLVQDRLDGVRGQIEQVQGRINLLEHLTDLATITVHLGPPGMALQVPTADGGPHPLNAATAAWDSSLTALRGLAAAALVVGVFSWWLLPPLAALAVGARWWLGHRPRPAPQSPR